jgi:acyl-CoA dehydrogenase
MKTRARRDGEGHVLNGSKMWISNGPILDLLMVVARMEDGDGGKSRYSTFLVDAKAPGVTVSKPTELMMRSAGGVSQIFFDDVRLPADAVLGGVEGRGLSAGLNNITQTRLATGARMLAACELAFVLTVAFVQDRMAFGQRVLDFQNTQFKLAQIKTEITVGRGFLDDLMLRACQGEELTTESAMAKLWLSELEGRVMDECVQLHGGAGFSNEYPISKMYAFARVHRIYLGTSEIQKLTIARSIL